MIQDNIISIKDQTEHAENTEMTWRRNTDFYLEEEKEKIRFLFIFLKGWKDK